MSYYDSGYAAVFAVAGLGGLDKYAKATKHVTPRNLMPKIKNKIDARAARRGTNAAAEAEMPKMPDMPAGLDVDPTALTPEDIAAVAASVGGGGGIHPALLGLGVAGGLGALGYSMYDR